MSAFIYRNLTPFKKRIRLLTIWPPVDPVRAEDDALVRCTITHASLDDHPPYFALSYTWGDASDTSPILLDNNIFFVTTNLQAALAHLAANPGAESVTAWIDALCIDQKDEVEKSEQVEQMREIYANATHVIAWLGPARDRSDVAMDWIERCGSLACGFGIGTRRELYLRQLLQDFKSDPDGFLNRELKHLLEDLAIDLSPQSWAADSVQWALSRLFERPYWHRIWIVQEVVHAKSVTFLCGDKSISEDVLHYATRLIRNYGRYICLETSKHMNSAKSATSPAIRLIDIRSAVNLLKIRRAPRRSGLVPLLRWFGASKASDPRDKIYALLGFSNDAHLLELRPDYKKHCRDVYIDTTMAIYKKNGLELLSLVGRNRNIPDLPSWVPDFSAEPDHKTLQECSNAPSASPVSRILQPPFHSSGTSTHTDESAISFVRMEQRPSEAVQMRIKATYLDKVDKTGTTWKESSPSQWLKELHSFSMTSKRAMNDDDIARRAWSTAVAGQQIRNGLVKPRLSESLLEKVHRVLSSIDLADAGPSVFESLGIGEYLFQLQDTSGGRRPFQTSSGLIGIGPDYMYPGDCVYVLANVPVPFLLRPTTSLGVFQVVGEAFVHGMMDGEAMEGQPLLTEVTLC